ncbi:hypothetical protein ACQ4M3_37175 [Leptolyngbya sp. AN03gr2]|uniref:hypothetical protein n=1 Tax=unclassified Leptolyngbya TaxID=2650499 RepID=UPI003D316F04
MNEKMTNYPKFPNELKHDLEYLIETGQASPEVARLLYKNEVTEDILDELFASLDNELPAAPALRDYFCDLNAALTNPSQVTSFQESTILSTVLLSQIKTWIQQTNQLSQEDQETLSKWIHRIEQLKTPNPIQSKLVQEIKRLAVAFEYL